MAVFTAIATAIVGAVATAGTILGSTALFNLAVGVVATGLAAGTAKLLGVFEPPKLPNQADPGVKIQIPPATDNKVPKMYGANYTGGIITDAEIKNQNNTMAYCLVISEYAAGETWSVSQILRGDGILGFGSSSQSHVVKSIRDTNNGFSSGISDKIRVRVYAGGSEASNQIFPSTGTPVAAYNFFDSWTSANTMEDLVFAIIEIDYDPEENLTGLGAFTFKIENSVHNPADVLTDYLTNSRYGAGLNINLVDTDSLDDLRSFSNALVDYSELGSTVGTHERYRIDGALSTFNTVKDNIDEICRNAGCFFSYNAKDGKFAVVSNRAATSGEKAAAFVFDSDNTIGKFEISSQELYNIYNSVEVEYPSFIQKDQTDTVFVEISAGERNANEPDNTLNYRLNMTNNRARAINLATVDLTQSRYNTVLKLEADYSSMGVKIGEVVKVTEPVYGFNEKLFRVMRTTEKESADGLITVEFLLLEYSDDVYDHIDADIEPELANSNISAVYVINGNADITIGNVAIVDDLGSDGRLVDFDTGSTITTDTISNIRSNYFVQSRTGSFVSIPVTVSNNGRFDSAIVSLRNAENPSDEVEVTQRILPPFSRAVFEANKQYHFTLSLNEFSDEAGPVPLEISLQFVDGVARVASPIQTSANISIDVKNIINSVLLGNGVVQSENLAANVIDVSAIADGAITASKIAANAVIAGKIAANAVTQQNIQDLAINADKIAQNAIIVDKIAANAVIAGKIAANAVTQQNIQDLAINAQKIATNAIVVDKIAANAVVAGKIAADAVEEINIVTSAISETKIASNAISSPKIAAGAVIAGKISAGAVTAGTIAANAVTAATIEAGAVTAGKISANAVTATTIAAGAITSDKILANAITAGKINANAVTATTIAAGSILSDKIGANAVVAGKIDTNAVTAGTIAAGAVTADKILANAVTAVKLAANSVVAGKIDTNAVTAGTIAAGAVTAGTIAANAVTSGTIAALSITSDKIDVNDLSALSADLGTITAGSINIGSGAFVVTSGGALTATSASVTGTVSASSFTLQSGATLTDTGGLITNTVNKGKTIALLLNKNSDGTTNDGEGSLVGVDNLGSPVLNSDGFFIYNGTKYTVNRNQFSSVTFATQAVDTKGFLAYDLSGANFSIAQGASRAAFVWRQDDQWYYDPNDGTATTFTPTANIVALAFITTSTPADAAISGGLLAEPITLESISEISADYISVGTLNADRIQLDNITMDTDAGGNLIIKQSGVNTLQIADNAVTVPNSDTFSGTLAADWPNWKDDTNGLPNVSITLDVAGDILVLYGARFSAASTNASDIGIRIYEDATLIESIGNQTGVSTLNQGGFIGGAVERSKAAGTYTYIFEWRAFQATLYEAYIIVLGVQR